MKIIGLDRFARFTSALNADMNDMLNAIQSRTPGDRLRRRLKEE